VGCSNLVPPSDAWLRRTDNEATIGCYATRQRWNLRCDGNRWTGTIGVCSEGNSCYLFIGADPGIYVTFSTGTQQIAFRFFHSSFVKERHKVCAAAAVFQMLAQLQSHQAQTWVFVHLKTKNLLTVTCYNLLY